MTTSGSETRNSLQVFQARLHQMEPRRYPVPPYGVPPQVPQVGVGMANMHPPMGMRPGVVQMPFPPMANRAGVMPVGARVPADKNLVPQKIKTESLLHNILTSAMPQHCPSKELEEMLMTVADDFVDTVAMSACKMARHRRSTTLDIKDIMFVLEKDWGIVLPGFAHLNAAGPPDTRAAGRANRNSRARSTAPKQTKTSAHAKRTQVKRKAESQQVADLARQQKNAAKVARVAQPVPLPQGGAVSAPVMPPRS